jgi:hypothetical protein
LTNGTRFRVVVLTRIAFVTALVVSAALYAYSLVGIAGAGGDLRSQLRERPIERPAAVADVRCAGEHADRVRL